VVELHPVLPSLEIVASEGALALSPEIEARVERLWEETLESKPWLFDGQLFHMTRRSEARIEGFFVPYRFWMATRTDPSLKDIYTLAPLAVTGLTRVSEGLVLGERSLKTTQDAGLWELTPAGSLDQPGADGRLSPAIQLLAELEEELGVTASNATEIGAPRWLVHDVPAGVWDVVLPLDLGMNFAELRAAFQTRDSDELRALRVVAPDGIADLLTQDAATLAPVSRAILEALALRPRD
jgi:hypothetical protein